jgi:hypothetical protein
VACNKSGRWERRRRPLHRRSLRKRSGNPLSDIPFVVPEPEEIHLNAHGPVGGVCCCGGHPFVHALRLLGKEGGTAVDGTRGSTTIRFLGQCRPISIRRQTLLLDNTILCPLCVAERQEGAPGRGCSDRSERESCTDCRGGSGKGDSGRERGSCAIYLPKIN